MYYLYYYFKNVIHWFQEVKDLARPGFIIDDIDNGMIDEDSDGEDELFDSVCAICDNGGQLLWYIFFVGYFNFVWFLCALYSSYFT